MTRAIREYMGRRVEAMAPYDLRCTIRPSLARMLYGDYFKGRAPTALSAFAGGRSHRDAEHDGTAS